MKITNARAMARLLAILYKFKILSVESCDKLIDHLTVRVLRADLMKRHPKDISKEDFDGKSSEET